MAILLDEVSCQGYESSLYTCGHNQIGYHDCSHYEDAGVICESDGEGCGEQRGTGEGMDEGLG